MKESENWDFWLLACSKLYFQIYSQFSKEFENWDS